MYYPNLYHENFLNHHFPRRPQKKIKYLKNYYFIFLNDSLYHLMKYCHYNYYYYELFFNSNYINLFSYYESLIFRAYYCYYHH